MHAYTVREAYGTVGLVTSFNYPLLLAAWKLGPALAAGNCAIVKPAPQTPLTTLALANMASDIFPPGVLQVLPGDANVARRLLAKVDKSSFTGSTLVGQAIQRKSGESLVPGVLECGGNNAVVVLKDADIQEAANIISQGAFSNAGQNCCAISRVYVHDNIYENFLAHLKEETMKWKAIDPCETVDSSVYPYGPLIDKTQYDLVYPYTQKSHEGWKGPEGEMDGFYIPPTVYTNVPEDSPLVAQEIFGPVVSVMTPFKTTEEAIQRANSSEYGLVSAVFSRDHREAHKVAAGLKTGVVWINTYNIVPSFLPFGGRKMSGIGKELGRAGLDEFTFVKSIMVGL
ncbi:aldehyde dehydrogenase domain-containing protein [Phycomyces nitens]|nr:aldehyde dehydrogenase domain-containing protein [Phycomyces nitens]